MRELIAAIILISCCTSLLAQTREFPANKVLAKQSQSQARQPSRPVSIIGRVVDAKTGEPISKVKVIVVGSQQSTTTNENGNFTLQNLEPGEIELYVTTVGYGLVKREVLLKEGEDARLAIALNQEAAPLIGQVTITAGPYDLLETSAASEQKLSKTELQPLSTVLLGDPLRAAQALPGVSTNDDFRSELVLRGAGFNQIALYIDGVLTDNFVHTVQNNFLDTGSISIVNADTIGSVSLLSGAPPAKYGDGTAGVLNLETREGNRVKPSGRILTSLSNTSGIFDGPLGKGAGSWLLAARKSYLGYLTRRINDANNNTDNPPILDFSDIQGKSVYDLSSRHQIGFTAIFGTFDYDRNRPPALLALNRVLEGDSRNLFINGHWRYTPHSQFIADTRLFGLRTTFTNTNRDGLVLDDGTRSQVGVRSDFRFIAKKSHNIEAGLYVRSRMAERFSERFQFLPSLPSVQTAFNERGTEQSYYIQDTWSSERLGISLTGGGRAERYGLTDETRFSPRASFGLVVANRWKVRLGAGRYYQFPDFEELFGQLGNSNLRAARSTHYNASVERNFGSRLRALAEVYYREDSNLLFSLSDPRTVNGVITLTEFPFSNSLEGKSRGIELTLQRRSANGLTGWVSYAYSRNRQNDRASGLSFYGDFDQRHTVNAFASYRFTESVNLSGQWRYGSGTPILGFFRRSGPDLFLASERNLLRLPAYSRVDMRVNKAFLFKKWKLTLYGEVLNVLNRENLRFAGFDAIGPGGQVFGSLDNQLPILPSAGIAIEF